jgi:hypothetical protein
MRANTQAISIDADPAAVFAFLADMRNLPRWAVGFARAVREEDGGWQVTTASGELPIRIEADERRGTIDFRIGIAPGAEALVASRVVPRGPGSEYVFTHFQGPGMPDDAFAMNVGAVQHELQVLKAVLEVQCPL